MNFIPTKIFFTKGVGIHKEQLTSFDLALRDAGIAAFNLVPVSSIFPPNCRKVSREEGLKILKPGSIVFGVLAKNATNEPNRLIAASIGTALAQDNNQYGYLSEHHSFGQTNEKAGEYAEDLAAKMLATTFGIELDPYTAWDEREQIYKASGKIFKTFNTTQSALGNKEGFWTSAIAAAIFIFE